MKNKDFPLFKCLIACVAVSLSLGVSGCHEAGTTRSTTSDSTATTKRQDSAKVAGNGRTPDVGLTLPVLDALFYEDNFGQELKTKLQLTDDQVQKLKAASGASVADLSEDGTGDYLGSARNAAAKSEAQIRSILGDEKATQLHQYVSQRYASGDVDGLLPSQPNSVPTDTRIVVNAPAFRMDVFQEGKLVKTYRIGIGYPEFPLPAGMRRAETIIFNPTWTPPDEPWVKGKVSAGKKVDAGSKLNPLGPIKIPIGMPSLIHGGKAVAKLGNFASHGCVGLTNDQVRDFAATLAQLSGSLLTPEDIQAFGAKKTETKSYKLAKAIPVELRYETIVGEPGGLRIFRDVYERGTNTLENAQRILDLYGVKYESLSPQEQAALRQALADMNRDPQGNPIVTGTDAASGMAVDSAAAGGADTGKNNNDQSKSDRAKKGLTTKSVVGRKEVAVPIAALQGKGYPAPINLNAGVPTKAASSGSTH